MSTNSDSPLGAGRTDFQGMSLGLIGQKEKIQGLSFSILGSQGFRVPDFHSPLFPQ